MGRLIESLRNQRGQGIAQILVGVAISGIVMSSMIAFQVSQANQIRALNEKLTVVDLQRSISGFLADPVSCSSLFNPSNLVGVGAVKISGSPTAQNPLQVNLNSISSFASAGAQVLGSSNSVYILPNTSLKSYGIQLQVTGSNPNTALVNIDFDQSKLAHAIHNLSFPITYYTTGTTVTSCGTSVTPSTMCATLGGTWNASKSPQCSLSGGGGGGVPAPSQNPCGLFGQIMYGGRCCTQGTFGCPG